LAELRIFCMHIDELYVRHTHSMLISAMIDQLVVFILIQKVAILVHIIKQVAVLFRSAPLFANHRVGWEVGSFPASRVWGWNLRKTS
jgi:hypothetical protein